MIWPEIPSCHNRDDFARRYQRDDEVKPWRPPSEGVDKGGYDNTTPFRTCWFCGSINPQDLFELAQINPIRLASTDWKYGWPHKFYVEGIRHPRAGEVAQVGATHYRGVVTPIMGEISDTVSAKLYVEHFMDEGYDDEAFKAFQDLVYRQSGILFAVEAGRLRYRCV